MVESAPTGTRSEPAPPRGAVANPAAWGEPTDEVERLRELNRRKDEFLAVLAHELRNPLAPLRNGVHVARMVGTADPTIVSLLAMMDRQLGAMCRLVDDLLDVSRLDAGKLQVEPSPISLNEVAREACELMKGALEVSCHRLLCEFPEGDCIVFADADRLRQVFVNLLTNAAKYSNRGTLIRFSITREDGRAIAAVRDEGVGLTQDDVDGIFNMYSQVRLHRARAEGGLGIGLCLVRSLVELHGGEVEAFSDGPGTGSTFVVRLPLRDVRSN